jgi:hypothetical protein
MATDYREVLKELRAEEKKLENDLAAIRAMIPGAEVMVARMTPASKAVWVSSSQMSPTSSKFSGMQVKEAILRLLSETPKPLMPAEITKALMEGDVQTKSQDLSGNVASTLNQMKNEIERVEGGWRLKNHASTQDRAWERPFTVHANG